MDFIKLSYGLYPRTKKKLTQKKYDDNSKTILEFG